MIHKIYARKNEYILTCFFENWLRNDASPIDETISVIIKKQA